MTHGGPLGGPPPAGAHGGWGTLTPLTAQQLPATVAKFWLNPTEELQSQD